MDQWLVKYKVEGFGDDEKTQGPYGRAEAEAHLADIKGFEGVHSAYLAPVPDEAGSS